MSLKGSDSERRLLCSETLPNFENLLSFYFYNSFFRSLIITEMFKLCYGFYMRLANLVFVGLKYKEVGISIPNWLPLFMYEEVVLA